LDWLIDKRGEEASPWLICFCFVKRRCAGSRGFFRCRTASRVDDRRIVSAIVFVIRNGLRWRDAPGEYGPHKTIYNRFIRWSRLGVFNKIFAELARKGGKAERIMIDATHLKAHRTAASLLKKGLFPDVSDARKGA
jgi:putative transposase